MAVTADLLVEDIDFRLEWTRPQFLGHKALAVSLSDVAAMGASPSWALLTLAVPTRIWKGDWVDKFFTGWFKLAKQLVSSWSAETFPDLAKS
jgi:thiamine-monophosphate kinase